MRCINLFILIFLTFAISGNAQKSLKKKFKLPSVLSEVSGLVLENDSTFWWHNDSGANPQLFCTNGRGELIKTIDLSAVKNIDWEDLTHNGNGKIYIGDFGNNANKRRNLKIYIVDTQTPKIDSIGFHYPDQKEYPPAKPFHNFDMEAFFWFQDSLHLFSKNKLKVGSYYTKHYVMSAQPGFHTPELRDSIFLKKRVVTGAAIQQDGSRVVLITYNYKKLFGFLPSSGASIFIFSNYKNNAFLKGKMKRKGIPPFLIATQYEAIDFLDNEKIYIASEKTAFIKQKARRLKIKASGLQKKD